MDCRMSQRHGTVADWKEMAGELAVMVMDLLMISASVAAVLAGSIPALILVLLVNYRPA